MRVSYQPVPMQWWGKTAVIRNRDGSDERMVRNINAICDREGIPEKDRARLALLALNPLMYSPVTQEQ